MKHRTSWLAASVCAAVMAVGCASDSKHEDVPMTAVPGTVTAGVQKAFPGATIKEVEKETYKDGTVHWEVEFTTQDGTKMEREFNAAGDLLDRH